MSSQTTSYWKRIWRWVHTESLSTEELQTVFSQKILQEELKLGLLSYKPLKADAYKQLQTKYPDQTKLLSVVQSLQQYIDVDCFQVWDILKHHLCDISYGTPESALKNVAFVDTRPTFLLPNVWKFYYAERLFLLKLVQKILEYKNDDSHIYNKEFSKLVSDIGMDQIKSSLMDQFDKVISTVPPSRRIQNDFSSDTVTTEWAEHNLREQLTLLQCLLLVANESTFTIQEFKKLFDLFRKHSFGKRQNFNNILEERHREQSLRILHLEVSIFMVLMDACKIKNLTSWLDDVKETVESELTKLQLDEEHSAMLMTWMMLTLQSEKHARQFENHYQHFGATALKLRVFEFLKNLVDCYVFDDNSKCALIAKQRVFTLMNELCDKFDRDGTLSNQPGVVNLCTTLLRKPEIANHFWKLHSRDEDFGVVSIWNTALEYFPYNFKSLSVLAGALSEAGKSSVKNLLQELNNLPIYTEIYNPHALPLLSLQSDDAVIGRDYSPSNCPLYHVKAGSKATIMERKEGTFIHFRTPYSYWTVLNSEIEKSLDRRGQYNLNETLQRLFEGATVLQGVLECLSEDKEIPKVLVSPSEGVFDVLVRFMKTDATPLPLLVSCLQVCTALVPLFPSEIHLRLLNTGVVPRVSVSGADPTAYVRGAGLNVAAVGSYLVDVEQPNGTYHFLNAYIDMLGAFYETTREDKVITDLILPGLVLILREVFPNILGWRYSSFKQREAVLRRTIGFLNEILQQNKDQSEAVTLLQKICVYSLLHTENALELLKIVALGNDKLEQLMYDEPNWIDGAGTQFISTIQRSIAITMLVLRLKSTATDSKETTALEQLILAPNKHKDELKVVPKVTSYLNHVHNKNLAVLCCRLLKKFAEGFQMSMFSSLDMSAYQVRVMFLDRLRDDNERPELKIAILEFVAICVGKQPGLTEAFFKLNHETPKDKDAKDGAQVKTEEDSFDGIIGFMAEYLGTVKSDPKLLHSPLLACIMELFHALWKNNMQILVRELRANSAFWDHLTSPLFSSPQPRLRTYAQILNVIGIELFLARGDVEPGLSRALARLTDPSQAHLDTWIRYVYSFRGRHDPRPPVDRVPAWLGLLTSWKDFTTILCKFSPVTLNIAHKAKMVAPCLSALLDELEDLRDGRLVVILAELYVIMLANWKEDCFDDRKENAKHIDRLLTGAAGVYECLHPRARRAVLGVGALALGALDYEIKASSATAQSVIRAVTDICGRELAALADRVAEGTPDDDGKAPDVVLALALLDQCLDLYDDMFSGLRHWFRTTRFANKLLSCLQSCVQSRRYYRTSLAALRCLTAYARGPFAQDLLHADVDRFLWMQLLPPRLDGNWSAPHWWRVYAHGLDFIAMMVMKNGQYFVGDAITFVGVHLEHLSSALLLPRRLTTPDALQLCAAALNLVGQLVRYEDRWRTENIHSLVGIMRSITVCVHQCVTTMLRSRRPSDASGAQLTEDAVQNNKFVMQKTLEIFHMSTLCLLAFSPSLLSLLADPALDLERYQPLVELDFAAPNTTLGDLPQLTFGTLLTAISLLTKSLNHSYSCEDGSGSRSPRRRGSAGVSPVSRADSLTSVSSANSHADAPPHRLAVAAAHAALTLLAEQALLTLRDPNIPARHKQLVRRELSSELTVYHDFIRKRILYVAHARSHLTRNKLGIWPLAVDEDEAKKMEEAARIRNPCDDKSLPPPPPPKRASTDSMREYILRKQYLDKCAQTPIKEPPSPVSHSTPTSDKKKEVRSSKRVSWAETTRDSDEDMDSSLTEIEPAYSNLTDVQISGDEDYFHFMSVVFLFICQNDL